MEIIEVIENRFGSYLDPEPYRVALPELLLQLPPGAGAFASDPDHYDFQSERCVKDLKLIGLHYEDHGENLTVIASFRFNELLVVEELRIVYSGVRELSVTTHDSNPVGPSRLGVMMLDEILPVPLGASHEFAFHGGRMWLVCEDLVAKWLPPGALQVDSGVPN